MTRWFRHTPAPRAALAGLLAVLLMLCLPALADDGDRDQDEAMRALQSGAVLPLRDILDHAGAQFRGEMLEAELERENSAWVYELEMMTPRGSVLKLWYDAADGTLIDGRGHGLMRAYKGDPATLPERLRRRHETMMERHREHMEDGGAPWHRRWFRHWWGEGEN